MAKREVKKDHSAISETTALLEAEKKKGVRLEPEEELPAKPEFPEISGQRVWWQPALAIFYSASGWILAPLLLGLFLGKWLDRRYDTAPWIFLATTMIAFLISMFGLIRNAMRAFKQIEGEDKSKAKNDERDE